MKIHGCDLMNISCPKCNCKLKATAVYMKYIDGVWVDSGKCTGSKLHHYEVEVVE